MDDQAMLDALRPHTQESSLWSARAGKAKLTLLGTKRQVYMACPAIHECMGYRWFLKRLLAGRLGIGAATRRTDLCDYCRRWDTEEAPSLTMLLQRKRDSLTMLDPAFWDRWDRRVEQVPELLEAKTKPEESSQFLEALACYIHNQALYNLDDDVREFCIVYSLELNARVPVVKGYQIHWTLRDNQWKVFRAHCNGPAAKTIYIHWDMQETMPSRKHTFFLHLAPVGQPPQTSPKPPKTHPSHRSTSAGANILCLPLTQRSWRPCLAGHSRSVQSGSLWPGSPSAP